MIHETRSEGDKAWSAAAHIQTCLHVSVCGVSCPPARLPACPPSPVPEITWRKLDGELPLGHKVETAGAHLRLYNVQVKDGGTYQCEAVNSKGKDYHSARVSVEGMQRVADVK